MLKQPLFLTTFIFIFNLSFGQSTGIYGKVTNEQKEPLEFVSVALLKLKDSTLINYTITDIKGDFKLNETPKDSLVLQLSYMGYQSHFEKIKNGTHDLKTITLQEDLKELDAITISAVIPMQVKKDTIAYNASSFKVNPDENLEELLKKLPGIEIDADGNIVAQGNEVTKIFVDGKEFFSGDPAIVLKNLSADAIAKIEVIDKKSDESEVTGVDDGNKQMVINFSLKKTNKNQGFGKLSGGIGLDSRYFTNLNYNRFSPKTQVSVIAKFNNINVTGSNIQGFLKNSDGLTDEEESDNSTKKKPKSLSGFLKTGVAGVHIGHEFKKKEDFNADYFYNLSDNRGTSQSKRISFTNTNNFDYISNNDYARESINHNLNFNYNNKSNKTNGLTLNGHIISNVSNSNLNVLGSYFSEEGELTTINNQTLNNKSDNKSGNININFYQKLQKAGRNFSTGFLANISERNRKNLQNTINNRKLNTENPTIKEITTLRDETLKRGVYNFNFRYNEPLGGHHYLKIQSFLKRDNQDEDVYQLKKTITNDNEQELLAFKYKHIEHSYKTKLAHSYASGKLNLFNGFELQNYNRSFGVIDEPRVTKSLISLNPTSTILYKPKRGVKYRFIYKKVIRTPRSSQSSTVINDLNPFYIRKGNPNLEAEKNE